MTRYIAEREVTHQAFPSEDQSQGRLLFLGLDMPYMLPLSCPLVPSPHMPGQPGQQSETSKLSVLSYSFITKTKALILLEA